MNRYIIKLNSSRLGLLTSFFLIAGMLAGCIASLPELNTKNECIHEDFVNRVSAANQCLVLDVFKSANVWK